MTFFENKTFLAHFLCFYNEILYKIQYLTAKISENMYPRWNMTWFKNY
jgi:hypothetical protein